MRLPTVVLGLLLPLAVNLASAQAVRDVRETVRRAEAFHIQVPSESAAKALHGELAAAQPAQRLELFKRLAQEHSMDTISAARGGALGLVWDGQTAPPFEEAMFASKPGEVGPPVRTSLGYHLIYVAAFRHQPLAPFCERTLQDAIAQAKDAEKRVLQMSARPLDRERLLAEVAALIGPGWQGPLQDADGNLVYTASGPARDGKLRIARRHVDFVQPWVLVSPAMEGCRRSRREEWVVDCEAGKAGLSTVSDYEGRAAHGRRLDHLQTSRLDPLDVGFRAVARGSHGAQMLAQACGEAAAARLLPGYPQRLVAFLKPHIQVQGELQGNPEAEVEVRTLRDGSIVQVKLVRSSGVAAWDKAVIQALEKAGRLPPDQDGKAPARVTFAMRARD